jgi:hypothetical protein
MVAAIDSGAKPAVLTWCAALSACCAVASGAYLFKSTLRVTGFLVATGVMRIALIGVIALAPVAAVGDMSRVGVYPAPPWSGFLVDFAALFLVGLWTWGQQRRAVQRLGNSLNVNGAAASLTEYLFGRSSAAGGRRYGWVGVAGYVCYLVASVFVGKPRLIVLVSHMGVAFFGYVVGLTVVRSYYVKVFVPSRCDEFVLR